MSRRILFVDHAGVLGGAEFSLLDIVAEFGADSAVVLFADGPFRAELQRRGIRVEVDAMRALAGVKKRSVLPSPAAVFDTVGIARRLAARCAQFDVIYANSQKAFVVSAIAGWLARRPVVWHLRDILGPPHFGVANVRAAVWIANRFAALVIANSDATADAFVAAGGRRSLVRVVHNGIDAGPFDAVTDEAARRTRATLGVEPGVPVVIHVGRFHHWKGQQVLLQALALEPRAHAWIVGAPLFGEHAFADELLAQAAALGPRVQLLGFRDDIPALIRAADIVVNSSVYPEPFGRVIVEGMLAGRPVIASDAGGAREIVVSGEIGYLVPPADPAALAAAIGRVIDRPDEARAVAARGSAHARAHFDRATMIAGVRAALATLPFGEAR